MGGGGGGRGGRGGRRIKPAFPLSGEPASSLAQASAKNGIDESVSLTLNTQGGWALEKKPWCTTKIKQGRSLWVGIPKKVGIWRNDRYVKRSGESLRAATLNHLLSLEAGSQTAKKFERRPKDFILVPKKNRVVEFGSLAGSKDPTPKPGLALALVPHNHAWHRICRKLSDQFPPFGLLQGQLEKYRLSVPK